MKITLIKNLNGVLKPAYDSDYELVKKIPLNEPITFEWSKPRNYKFHKKFFALINLVYQNQEQYNNIEHLRKELTICAGHYDLIFDLDTGQQKKEAQSIKFSSIDEIEFNKIYNDVLEVVVNKFNFQKREINEHIEQYF